MNITKLIVQRKIRALMMLVCLLFLKVKWLTPVMNFMPSFSMVLFLAMNLLRDLPLALPLDH